MATMGYAGFFIYVSVSILGKMAPNLNAYHYFHGLFNYLTGIATSPFSTTIAAFHI
jgi:hypothetical protein